MHKAFLILGQQMGMQNMRNILPSEIDVFINAAIIDEVRKVLISNANANLGDKVSIKNNGVSPVNFLRTLYKSETKSAMTNKVAAIEDVLAYVSLFIKYNGNDNIYPCRIIEQDKLATTLNDYCNGASFDYPIATFFNDHWEIYSDNKQVDECIINYIKTPTKVCYETDTSCDLPEYTHNQIVEAAITKYFASIGSTTNNV